jgi:hypothetical protein
MRIPQNCLPVRPKCTRNDAVRLGGLLSRRLQNTPAQARIRPGTKTNDLHLVGTPLPKICESNLVANNADPSRTVRYEDCNILFVLLFSRKTDCHGLRRRAGSACRSEAEVSTAILGIAAIPDILFLVDWQLRRPNDRQLRLRPDTVNFLTRYAHRNKGLIVYLTTGTI